MMKQKCVAQIREVREGLDDLCDSLGHLEDAIEADDEDKANDALQMFPKPRVLARTLEKLGKLIETRPWEDKRKAHAG